MKKILAPLSLCDAAASGNTDAALKFLRNGASIEERGINGYTPLMHAAINGHEDMVMMLCDFNANTNVSSRDDKPIISCMITEGAEPELAPESVYVEIIKYLNESGADINRRDNRNFWTPALYAGHHKMVNIALCLSDIGANMSATTKGGRNAIMLLASTPVRRPPSDYARFADIIRGYRWDLDIQDNEGDTMMISVAKNARTMGLQGASEIVFELMQRGANPDVRNEVGADAITYAPELEDVIRSVSIRKKMEAEPDFSSAIAKNRFGAM